MNRHDRRAQEAYQWKNRPKVLERMAEYYRAHKANILDANIKSILRKKAPIRFKIAEKFQNKWVNKVLGIRFEASKEGESDGILYKVLIRNKQVGEFIV